jgi:hypothetical protein
MLFDPDDGRTIEEIIQRVWEQEWSAERRASILAIAEARGCTWFEVVCEGMERYLEMVKDPILGPRLQAQWEFENAPFGIDPLMERRQRQGG